MKSQQYPDLRWYSAEDGRVFCGVVEIGTVERHSSGWIARLTAGPQAPYVRADFRDAERARRWLWREYRQGMKEEG